MIVVDLIGEKFGRLTVLAKAGVHGKHRHWFTVCDCGGFMVVRGDTLAGGQRRSCGCLFAERMKNDNPNSKKRRARKIKQQPYTDPLDFLFGRKSDGTFQRTKETV